MWRHQVTRQKKPFTALTPSFPTQHIIWWRWKSSRFGVTAAAGQENVVVPCGKLHIHPENYTLSSWHKAQLLFIVHLPHSLSKWWINCCSTWEKKEKSWEGKKGQIWARVTSQWATNQTVKEQPPLFGSLMKPQSDPAHDLQSWNVVEPTLSPLALKSLPAALTP